MSGETNFQLIKYDAARGATEMKTEQMNHLVAPAVEVRPYGTTTIIRPVYVDDVEHRREKKAKALANALSRAAYYLRDAKADAPAGLQEQIEDALKGIESLRAAAKQLETS
jgi:hypothetical protein